MVGWAVPPDPLSRKICHLSDLSYREKLQGVGPLVSTSLGPLITILGKVKLSEGVCASSHSVMIHVLDIVLYDGY